MSDFPYGSLLTAKQKISPPAKNRNAMYGRYADLESILKAVEGPLAEEGFVIVQRVVQGEPGYNYLRTELVDIEGGGSISSDVPLVYKNANDPQQLGGAITYARRYGITSLLNIVADDDDDGNTSSGKNSDGSSKKPPRRDEEKGVTQEQIEEAFTVKNGLSSKLLAALVTEYDRAGVPNNEVVPEVKALLGRDFGQLAELTEAEARTAAGHARKLKRGDAERLSSG